MTRTDKSAKIAAIAAALLIVVASSAFLVTAAGATTVGVEPEETTIEAGEMKTFEIVVHDSDGGIGAAEVAARVSNASVATIADVELQGEPGLADVSANDDNTTVEMLYIMADTNDTGPVSIAEVTVFGESSGTVEVSAGSIERNDGIRLFDEAGERYGEVEASPIDVTIETSDDGAGGEPRSTTGSSGNTGSSGSSSDGETDAGDGRSAEPEGDTDVRESENETDVDGTNADGATATESSSESDGGTEDSDDGTGSSPSPTQAESSELDDEEPLDQSGFGVLPVVIAILLVTYLTDRRDR